MTGFKGWKDTPEKVLARPSRPDRFGRNFAGAAGRRLHHRPAHRFDHVRRRRAGLPGFDSGDQVLRRGMPRAVAPGTVPISEMSPGADSRRLRLVHRRRRSCGRRHHQSVSIAADNLEWLKRRTG